jgi:hypothetical protein
MTNLRHSCDAPAQCSVLSASPASNSTPHSGPRAAMHSLFGSLTPVPGRWGDNPKHCFEYTRLFIKIYPSGRFMIQGLWATYVDMLIFIHPGLVGLFIQLDSRSTLSGRLKWIRTWWAASAKALWLLIVENLSVEPARDLGSETHVNRSTSLFFPWIGIVSMSSSSIWHRINNCLRHCSICPKSNYLPCRSRNTSRYVLSRRMNSTHLH